MLVAFWLMAEFMPDTHSDGWPWFFQTVFLRPS